MENDQHLVDSTAKHRNGESSMKKSTQNDYEFLLGDQSDDGGGELDDFKEFRTNANVRASYEELKNSDL